MTDTSLSVFVIAIFVPISLVFAWAIAMTVVRSFKDEHLTVSRFFTGYFMQQPYNRKYRRVMAACIAAFTVLWAIVMALFILGVVPL